MRLHILTNSFLIKITIKTKPLFYDLRLIDKIEKHIDAFQLPSCPVSTLFTGFLTHSLLRCLGCCCQFPKHFSLRCHHQSYRLSHCSLYHIGHPFQCKYCVERKLQLQSFSTLLFFVQFSSKLFSTIILACQMFFPLRIAVRLTLN